MLGIGVMLGQLSGNKDTVEAYQSAVNKTIVKAELSDDSLILMFDDGAGIKFYDDGQSCCESRYMRTDDHLSDFIGSKFLGAELKSAPDIDDSECHEVQFLEIKTDKGGFVMSSHNEHNGYYGGFNIVISRV